MSYFFISESVSEGHPDKIADQIKLWNNHKNYENKVYVLPKKS